MGYEGVRQFGTPLAGKPYTDRPGVYAVALLRGRVLVVETAVGWFLPGGGMAEGETLEATLRREVQEETGYTIAEMTFLGSARQFVGERVNKVETFFRVDLEGGPVQAELDHHPRWVLVEDAIGGLREEAQAWAVASARNAARA